jgi:hypothetical protein
MACKYCQNNETLLQRDGPGKLLVQISIENGHLVHADDFGIKGEKINFCPMCGEDLREDGV